MPPLQMHQQCIDCCKGIGFVSTSFVGTLLEKPLQMHQQCIDYCKGIGFRVNKFCRYPAGKTNLSNVFSPFSPAVKSMIGGWKIFLRTKKCREKNDALDSVGT